MEMKSFAELGEEAKDEPVWTGRHYVFMDLFLFLKLRENRLCATPTGTLPLSQQQNLL